MRTVATLLLALPVLALAGKSQEGSLRRRKAHAETARTVFHARRGASYTLVDNYEGNSFFDGFEFYTGNDPTHGTVNYLSQQDAQKAGIAYVQSDNTVVLGVDSTTQLSSGQSRNSVRVGSKKTYNGGLFIADFFAMPHGCAVWPAYWTVGSGTWPNNGELDLIEGVNLNNNNQITLHTGPTCTLEKTVDTVANLVGSKCTSADGDNAGCAYVQNSNATFGHGFNTAAGGVFAHSWDSNGVTVWFFPRNQVPADITNQKPDPSTWGTPAAIFPNTGSCTVTDHMHDHSIILDITLCGDWAGAAYANSGCPQTCADFVANPANFNVAKWKVASIRVYQQQ